MTPIIFSIPPCLIILSLLATESVAMFPKAHTVCSTVPICTDLSNLINNGITPLSTMDWHCWWVPEATFVSAQAASNCNCGNYYCWIYYINLGMNPISMTFCIGGLSVTDMIFLTPITP